ncbi:MAG: hypothetical protein KatS3mg077_0515 [Candidatus Binatia bacterium]|nr:MAG: hypothetical protein KatS3mg077_0515 [Candidatus Binatia bacterium]
MVPVPLKRLRSLGAAVGVAAALAALSAGCRAWSNGTPSAVEAERWARAWVGACNSRSSDQIAGLLADGGEYWSSLTGNPISAERLPAHIRTFWRLLPRARIEQRALHRGPGIIVLEWQAWPDSEKREESWKGVTILELHGGRVRRAKTFYNPGVLLPYFYAQGNRP